MNDNIEIQNELSYLAAEINRAKMQLSALKFQADQPASLPGNYTGKIVPARVGGTVIVPAGSVVQKYMVNVVIPPDGPFYAKSIHINFRTDNDGYWYNIHDWSNSFYWEYRVSGSNRDRQNVPVPSSLIERAEVGGAGFYELTPQDAFPKGTTVTIIMSSWVPLFQNNPYNTTIWAGFNGFYVLG